MAGSLEKAQVSGITTAPHQRSKSIVSREGIEFFDQQGIQELRKTLSRQSALGAQDQRSPSSAESAITFDETKGFNFEQVLRDKVQK